jgi:hypothetical protein
MPRMVRVPRRLRMCPLRLESMTLIVSMVAQIAAIAMTGFMKRMSDIPSPRCPTSAVRAIGLAGEPPTGTTVL